MFQCTQKQKPCRQFRFFLSQPLVKQSIRKVLELNSLSTDENTLDEIVTAVLESSILVNATAKGGELSSTNRRKTFAEKSCPVVKPVEYVLEPEHTVVYVPILDMMQKMFKHRDILDKVLETKISQNSKFMTNKMVHTIRRMKYSLTQIIPSSYSFCTLMILK